MVAYGAAAPLRLGPYELGERIGSGGMAEVYVGRRAGPRGFSKRFAIKRILPQLVTDPHFVSMFCDEARICAALSHPNIVHVVDFGESDGELFMAMEYVEGVSCARLLRAVASRGERVPLGAALFIAHEVLRALAYAHDAHDENGRPLGIVHRDVSPGNVLIGRAGEVKLTDFGIVRAAFIDRRTNPGELKGKIGYMSPEQAMGEEIDRRSDLFTTAIVLAELLLALPLFPGRDEVEILSRIHAADLSVLQQHSRLVRPDLMAALRTALSKRPEYRFQTATEFADALRAVARNAGCSLSESELVTWLSGLQLLPASGFRPAVSAPRVPIERAAPVASVTPIAPRRPSPAASENKPASLPTLVQRKGPEYELVLPEGRVAGSFGQTRLLELVVTGRLPPRTLVSVGGGALVPVGELPELAFVSHPVFAFGSLPPGLELGPLERNRLPALLYTITLSHLSGLLVLKAGRREKRILFRSGAPVLIASTAREELLGQRLVSQGVLTTPELDAALERSLEARLRLGAVLVERQLVRPGQLLRALAEQLEDRFLDLGAWRDGEVGFSAAVLPRDDSLPPLRRPAALVTRLVRTRFTDAELQAALRGVSNAPLAENPGRQFDAIDLGLDAGEAQVIGSLAGSRSLAEHVGKLAGSPAADTVRRAIFIALSARHVVSPGWLE